MLNKLELNKSILVILYSINFLILILNIKSNFNIHLNSCHLLSFYQIMDSDNEEEIERNFFRKLEKMEREFIRPGVKISIKRRTDGTMNYVRRCKNVHGELEYNAQWGVTTPFVPVVASVGVQNTAVALLPPAATDTDHAATRPATCRCMKEKKKEESKEESEEENKEENEEENEEEEYVPSSQESEESQEDRPLPDLLSFKTTLETQETQTQLLTQDSQDTSEGPPGEKLLPTVAATPSPNRRGSYCHMCDNYPCESKVEGTFLIKRAEKKYEHVEDNVDNTDFLQKLSDEFVDGYRLLKQHDMYLPGDDKVIDVDVPLCLYQRFHEWTKDLI